MEESRTVVKGVKTGAKPGTLTEMVCFGKRIAIRQNVANRWNMSPESLAASYKNSGRCFH